MSIEMEDFSMGYESRLYIVKASKESNYAEVIAMFNGRGMLGNDWKPMFDKLFEHEMYSDDEDTLITEDCYGEKLKYTDFPTVIEWLEKAIEKDDYRRLKPLLSLLKGFDLSQWPDGEMQIVHYGY